jgi:DNA-binding transcriptional MerR regulator
MSQMKQSDPNYNKITEEDQALLDTIHTEKHENISMNEIKDFIKEKNTKEQKSTTKLIKTELVPRAIDLLPDRSTKNKVSKRKTNFEESKQLILKALEQKSITEIIDEWNESNESQINERQLINLWSGKTELLPFEFNENSEWTYQDYCQFIKELPEKRKTIERS